MIPKSLELILFIKHVSISLSSILSFTSLFFCFVVDSCLNCNTNKRRLSDTDTEETDEVQFNDLAINQTDRQEFDHSHIRHVITAVQTSATNKIDDQFLLLQNAIQQGDIDLAIKIIKQTNEYLERKNDQGETPLLIAAKFNQNRLIIAILKKKSELAKQVDKQGNNLLHLLANVREGQAKNTIGNVLTLLDDKMREYLTLSLNRHKQTPVQVAQKYGNLEYIRLLNHKIDISDSRK